MRRNKGPVVHLNRKQKAKMIEAFLSDFSGTQVRGYKILDIGCGNGQISSHFAPHNDVHSVDVKDQRSQKDQFRFYLVEDERLPFEDATFDIVLSHHVIEHVEDQSRHLSELKRVLNQGGIGYLACPNGGSPFMQGHVGNDQVPNLSRIVELMQEQGFRYHDYYTKLLKYPHEYFCESKIASPFPVKLIKLFQRWYPGHCFILQHPLAKD